MRDGILLCRKPDLADLGRPVRGPVSPRVRVCGVAAVHHVTIVTGWTAECNSGYNQTMADDTLETLTAFQRRMNAMPARRAELIEEARKAGHSWPTIAKALGMTHPGAMKAAQMTTRTA